MKFICIYDLYIYICLYECMYVCTYAACVSVYLGCMYAYISLSLLAYTCICDISYNTSMHISNNNLSERLKVYMYKAFKNVYMYLCMRRIYLCTLTCRCVCMCEYIYIYIYIGIVFVR